MCMSALFSPSVPSIPAAPAPVIEPPKQAEKAPDASALRDQNKAKMTGGMSAGPASTLLTGPSGVDPTALALGKNTLLGG